MSHCGSMFFRNSRYSFVCRENRFALIIDSILLVYVRKKIKKKNYAISRILPIALTQIDPILHVAECRQIVIYHAYHSNGYKKSFSVILQRALQIF